MLLPFLIPTAHNFQNISNLQELTQKIPFNSDCKSWSEGTSDWERHRAGEGHLCKRAMDAAHQCPTESVRARTRHFSAVKSTLGSSYNSWSFQKGGSIWGPISSCFSLHGPTCFQQWGGRACGVNRDGNPAFGSWFEKEASLHEKLEGQICDESVWIAVEEHRKWREMQSWNKTGAA